MPEKLKTYIKDTMETAVIRLVMPSTTIAMLN